MNKKGFTLIELLTVISLLAIIALIAIPNMLGISEDVKNDNIVNDAKKLISLAKMKINTDYEARNNSTSSSPKTYTFNVLNANGDITKDPDNGNYGTDSYVKYYKSSNKAVYCVYLNGSKRRIGTSSSCVEEETINSSPKTVVTIKTS